MLHWSKLLNLVAWVTTPILAATAELGSSKRTHSLKPGTNTIAFGTQHEIDAAYVRFSSVNR
jgi:hypothetical protein